MKYLVLIVLIISPFLVIGQKTNSIANNTDSLSFSNRLGLLSNGNYNGITFTYFNLDTLNSNVDLKMNFHFSRKAYKVLKEDLLLIKDTNLKVSAITPQKGDLYNSTLIFRNVNLKWNNQLESIITSNTQIFEDSNMEIGDVITPLVIKLSINEGEQKLSFFFSINDNQWYFFDFNRSTLSCTSSNVKFTDLIKGLRRSKYTYKAKNEFPDYRYYICSDNLVKIHLRIINLYSN